MALAKVVLLLLTISEAARLKVWSDDGDSSCAWAKIDLNGTGWQCDTIKAFTGGMQGNTRLVKLTPPSGSPFKAVLKEMNSNQNAMGFHSLENERRIAEHLIQHNFTGAPMYYMDFKVQSKYMKYKNSDTMTMAEKDNCDYKRQTAGVCELNPEWDACNGHRGNLDTTKEIPRSKMSREGLECPDRTILMMEFLDGYADLPHLHKAASFRTENGFTREVRAAALFSAHDGLMKIGVSHCDYNPGNAMFSVQDAGKAKIIDFGLARLNDYPVGACRGNLEDIGTPGFLWLALYRGGTNELEWGRNDKRAGSLSLSSGGQFQTPSGQILQPFSRMKGRYSGKGGMKSWNQETRQNWPGIVGYANYLLYLYDSESDGGEDGALVPPPSMPEVMAPTASPTLPPTPSRPVFAPARPVKSPPAHPQDKVTSTDMAIVNTRELAQLIKTGSEIEYEGVPGVVEHPQIKGQAITFNFQPSDGSTKRSGLRVFWSSNRGKLKVSL